MTDETEPTLAELSLAFARCRWIFAKTMPENPHHYTLRKEWNAGLLVISFDAAVTFIRRHGYREKFKGKWYTQLDVNGHFYWTMGWPVPVTILINRKKLGVD